MPHSGNSFGILRKLDLSVRDKAYLIIETDADKVMRLIESFDGVLPFNDKASPAITKFKLISSSFFSLVSGFLLTTTSSVSIFHAATKRILRTLDIHV